MALIELCHATLQLNVSRPLYESISVKVGNSLGGGGSISLTVFPESVVLSRIRLAHLCAASAKLLVRLCYSLTNINVISATNRRLCDPTVKSIRRSG